MPYSTLDYDAETGSYVHVGAASHRGSAETVELCPVCGEYFDYDYEGSRCQECDEVHCDSCELCEATCDGCGCYSSDCDCDDDYSYGRPRGVHPWNYRPSPYKPKGDFREGATALMGVELEVGGRARTIADIANRYDGAQNHLYLKEDGSISGLEIVSHPMTLAWSTTFDFEGLLSDLSSDGNIYVDDGYGLHVHVSRNAFREHKGKRSHAHTMSWLLFLYRNADACQKFARRSGSRWASFDQPYRGELKAKATTEGAYSSERYVAVNANNERTFELRFFRSTLSVLEFRAAIEFADATVEYTRTLRTVDVLRNEGLSWDAFAAWVEPQPRYQNLAAELERVARDMEREAEQRAEREARAASRRAQRTAEREASTMGRTAACRAAGDGGRIRHSSGLVYVVGVQGDGTYTLSMATSDGSTGTNHPAEYFVANGWTVDSAATPTVPTGIDRSDFAEWELLLTGVAPGDIVPNNTRLAADLIGVGGTFEGVQVRPGDRRATTGVFTVMRLAGMTTTEHPSYIENAIVTTDNHGTNYAFPVVDALSGCRGIRVLTMGTPR